MVSLEPVLERRPAGDPEPIRRCPDEQGQLLASLPPGDRRAPAGDAPLSLLPRRLADGLGACPRDRSATPVERIARRQPRSAAAGVADHVDEPAFGNVGGDQHRRAGGKQIDEPVRETFEAPEHDRPGDVPGRAEVDDRERTGRVPPTATLLCELWIQGPQPRRIRDAYVRAAARDVPEPHQAVAAQSNDRATESRSSWCRSCAISWSMVAPSYPGAGDRTIPGIRSGRMFLLRRSPIRTTASTLGRLAGGTSPASHCCIACRVTPKSPAASAMDNCHEESSERIAEPAPDSSSSTARVNPSKSIEAGRVTGDERAEGRWFMFLKVAAATDIRACIGPRGSKGAVSDRRSRTSMALAGARLADPTSCSTNR